MSLTPFGRSDPFFRRIFDDMERAHRLIQPYWQQHFEMPETALNTGALGEVTNTKEKFAVSVDVSQFRPEELKVNVAGNVLSIEGHHEERNDNHGSIQRSFTRKFTLPEDTNLDTLRSSLSDNGKLSIEASKKAVEGPQSRAIPIQSASAKQ